MALEKCLLSKVRKASAGDIDKVMDCLREMYRENGLPLPPMDPEKVRRYTEGLILNQTLWVVEEHDHICGVLGLLEYSPWYSTGSVLGDLIFFVRPGCRGSGAATGLLSTAKEYAKLKGLPLFMATFDGKDLARKRNFYLKSKFKDAGNSFFFIP